MPALTSDGMIKVAIAATLSSLTAPILAQISGAAIPNAEERIDYGGLVGFEIETGRVETRPLAGTWKTQRMGVRSADGASIRWQRHDGVDPMANLLVYKANLYVVIRRNLDYAVAWASGQDVEVYPIECGEQKRMPPSENTLTLVETPVAIHTAAQINAVIA